MKVILLAAGAGKGFESQEPKALAPVKNKPMILHITEKIRQIKRDFEAIVVIKETEKEKFEHALEEKGHFRYAFQKESLGTADALKKAVEVLEDDDDLLIMYSDTLLIREASLAGMINNHQLQSNAVTFLSGVAWSTYPYALVKRAEGEVSRLME